MAEFSVSALVEGDEHTSNACGITLHIVESDRVTHLDELKELDAGSRAQIEEQLLSANPIFVEGRTALHLAAASGLEKVVAQLLIACPSLIDARGARGWTALHYAILAQLHSLPTRSDDWAASHFLFPPAAYDEVVAQLLAARPALSDAVDIDGRTALHGAASGGHERVVAQLLAVCDPASIDAADLLGLTAFHEAVRKGHEGVVAQLLAFRPTSVHALSASGWTVLHFAVSNQRHQIFSRLLAAVTQEANSEKLLLQRSTQYDTLVCKGSTVLHVAAQMGDRDKATQLLAACPALIDVVDEDDRTCAHRAAVESKEDILVTLLAFKPGLAHVVNAHGNTVLHSLLLSQWYSTELFEKVRELNPDAVHSANRYGLTPFHLAVENGNEDIIDLLQWILTVDEVMSAYSQFEERHENLQRFKLLLGKHCEEVAGVLIPDVAAIVFEYLGF